MNNNSTFCLNIKIIIESKIKSRHKRSQNSKPKLISSPCIQWEVCNISRNKAIC